VFIKFYQKDGRKDSGMAGNVARRKYMGIASKLQFEMQMEKNLLIEHNNKLKDIIKVVLKERQHGELVSINLVPEIKYL
jgi:hypothetical protein